MKGPSSSYDPQALAHAETYLINFLEDADPPRDANLFLITDAAQDYHASTGTWDLPGAGPQVLEDLLSRHAE